MRSKLVSFGVRPIQKGRRLALQNNLLQNLGVNEGDYVEVLFDSDEKAIVVRKPGTTNERAQRSAKK